MVPPAMFLKKSICRLSAWLKSRIEIASPFTSPATAPSCRPRVDRGLNIP